MANYTLKVESCHINLSPATFRLTAQDFFECYLDFKKTSEFTLVPFFLCCRAIELAFKSIHLETKSQADIKSLYSHDLLKAYEKLPIEKKTLSGDDVSILTRANEIYISKAFEYTNVFDAATAYSRFPDIKDLSILTKKIINLSA